MNKIVQWLLNDPSEKSKRTFENVNIIVYAIAALGICSSINHGANREEIMLALLLTTIYICTSGIMIFLSLIRREITKQNGGGS